MNADYVRLSGVQSGNGLVTIDLLPAAVGSVPEPATWSMMILGFGAIGVAMRRRKLTVRATFG